MKILVLGDDGMLGHVVKLYFQKKGHTLKGTSRSGAADYFFDVTKNLNDIEKYLEQFKPDVVINCTGILNQVAEDNHSLAVLLNSYLPHYLDELCQKKEIKLIHVSTDCVFDGKKGGYTEESLKDATTFYGQSKALGEINNNFNLTLRTSIVGPDINQNGIGLFQWFMKQKGRVDGYDKVIWSGVTTIEFARCMEKAIAKNLSGLRHVVSNKIIDKYSLLNLFKKYFNRDIIINRNSDYVSDKSLKRITDYDFQIPSYDQMVKEMADWVNEHESIYNEYQRVIK